MKKLAIIACLLFGGSCLAGEQIGVVKYVIVRASDGLVYFGLTGNAKTDSPACATGGYWMVRDESSNAGKQQYAMVLSAHATGKQVRVVGMNTCMRWSNGEDVNWIQVID